MREDFLSKPAPIGDSGDIGLISSVLIDVALCVDCIVKQTGVPASRVHVALSTIGKTVKVDDGSSPCSACKTTTQVFRLL